MKQVVNNEQDFTCPNSRISNDRITQLIIERQSDITCGIMQIVDYQKILLAMVHWQNEQNHINQPAFHTAPSSIKNLTSSSFSPSTWAAACKGDIPSASSWYHKGAPASIKVLMFPR